MFLFRCLSVRVGRINMPSNKPADATLNVVDSFTATRIQRLQHEKIRAIQEEDYDEAKRLKAMIEKLKGLGEQIKQLELQKRAAVEVEDYDAAKVCKLEIEMLRKCDGIFAESMSSPQEGLLICANTDRVECWRNQTGILITEATSEASSGGKGEISIQTLQEPAAEPIETEPKARQEQEQKNFFLSAHQDNDANGPADNLHHTSASQPAVSVKKEAFFPQSREFPLESRKEDLKKEASFAESWDIPPEFTKENRHAPVHRTAPIPPTQNFRQSLGIPQQISSQMQMSSSGEDLNAPEPLSEAVKAQCGPLLNLLDLYHVQCLYSKQWQLRDKAFHFIAKLLQSEGLGNSSGFRILDSVLVRALNDRVPNVFYGGLQLLKAYVAKYSSEVPARDLQHSSTEFVNILLDKLGDSNVRSKDAAAETLMFMASKKELGLDVVAKPLLRPTKNQAIWKPVLGRLNWLLVAIPTFGVQPQSRQGFSSEMLMSYVSQAINNPNGEVRNAAVKVVTEIYKSMGATVERYLKGIKPMIREVLLSNFERVALETRNVEGQQPLTFDELDNIPIPRRSRKQIYDIEKALDEDIQRAMSLEAQTVTAFEPQPIQSINKGKQLKDGGLVNMVVDQQDRPTNPEDLQTMYSTEATAPLENLTPSSREELHASREEATTEEEVLTEPQAPLQNCELQQSHRLDAGTDEPLSYPDQASSRKGCIDDEFQADKDELSDQCLFCGKQDSKFLVEDNLDLHFCQSCPMLVGCCNCKQIVEIASLKEHYLSECISGRRYVECSKCLQAIPVVRMTIHVKSKECRRGKHHKASRCPLCHHAVRPGDAGWREHLLKPPGCPKNPRSIITQ